MSNYNISVDVLAQALRDGASQEEIANMFAGALNKASTTVKQERAQKEKEQNEAKMKAAQVVADFYNTYYPNMFLGEEKATAEAIVKACDSIQKIVVSTDEIAKKIGPNRLVENPLFRIFNL